MARSTNEIKTKMLADVQANPTLASSLTSPSLTAIYNLWCYIVASCVNLYEQVVEQYISQAKDNALKTPSATVNYVKGLVFGYQYDPSGAAATNQVTILPGPKVGYASEDPGYKIVSMCCVKPAANGLINIKVAQGAGYSVISGAALTQLESYMTQVLPAGINHRVVSQPADEVAIYGVVSYKNGYAGIIQPNVEAALTAYLKNLSTGKSDVIKTLNAAGEVRTSGIINTILALEGVADFQLDKILCRDYSTAFGNASTLYDYNFRVDNRIYDTGAGYAIQETTSGATWADTLTYSADLQSL